MEKKAALNKALEEAKADNDFWGLNDVERRLALRVAENFYVRVSMYLEQKEA